MASPLTPWGRIRPVDEPRAVEVKGPRDREWRRGWLLSWSKRVDDPDGPWWGEVQLPPNTVGHWRQDWIRQL